MPVKGAGGQEEVGRGGGRTPSAFMKTMEKRRTADKTDGEEQGKKRESMVKTLGERQVARRSIAQTVASSGD